MGKISVPKEKPKDTVRASYDIPRLSQRKLKSYAAEKGLTLSELLYELAVEGMKRRGVIL